MEYKDIVNLVKLINKSELSEFKMKDGEFELSIRTDKYSKVSKEGKGATFVPMQQSPLAHPQQQQYNSPRAPQEGQSEASPPEGEKREEAQKDEGPSGDLVAIKSPIVGTFYRSSSPEKQPYIKVGDHVDVGSVVCIVEAMKLFNEIESEVSGKVVKVLVEDASPVEYDQVLFMVDPNG